MPHRVITITQTVHIIPDDVASTPDGAEAAAAGGKVQPFRRSTRTAYSYVPIRALAAPAAKPAVVTAKPSPAPAANPAASKASA
jgi:hypothetical protein